MTLTDNPTVFKCSRKSVWYPDKDSQLSYIHAFVMCVENEDDYPWMQIEVPPYTIQIIKNKDSAKSIIKKTIRKHKHKSDKSKNKEYTYQELLSIDEAISLPWNDRLKVLDRIHSYLVFS